MSGADGAAAPRRRARRRALTVAGALLALFAVNGAYIAYRLWRDGVDLAPGRPAPAFRGETLAGGTLALGDLRGQVVLLDFWATWCAPCVRELPALRRLAESRGPRGLVVVGIAIEGPTARRALADVVQEAGLRHATVLDDGEIRRRYRVEGLPYYVLVGRDGVVRRIFPGAPEPGELERAVDEILGAGAGG